MINSKDLEVHGTTRGKTATAKFVYDVDNKDIRACLKQGENVRVV